MTLLFFLSNKNSVAEVVHIFEHFSIFSGLKSNKSNCVITGIRCSSWGSNGAPWYGMCKPKKLIQLKY